VSVVLRLTITVKKFVSKKHAVRGTGADFLPRDCYSMHQRRYGQSIVEFLLNNACACAVGRKGGSIDWPQ